MKDMKDMQVKQPRQCLSCRYGAWKAPWQIHVASCLPILLCTSVAIATPILLAQTLLILTGVVFTARILVMFLPKNWAYCENTPAKIYEAKDLVEYCHSVGDEESVQRYLTEGRVLVKHKFNPGNNCRWYKRAWWLFWVK